MHVERLDHVNIRTADLEATKDFYVDVIGLRVGDRPPFSFAGYWLYDDATPVIHLTETTHAAESGTGSIDHVSFRAGGLRAMREGIRARGIAAEERTVPRNGDVQLFLADPNGVTIELTFRAEEAAE
ncbi:MAG: VOC family protein [Candidatus Velthaea sp.]